ncbi:MAG TPA: hypothetical protein VFF68_03750 [Anaerolineaceae bacterium]|nr:hypothetical protein [Anaerolineaceae bacterium]
MNQRAICPLVYHKKLAFQNKKAPIKGFLFDRALKLLEVLQNGENGIVQAHRAATGL